MTAAGGGGVSEWEELLPSRGATLHLAHSLRAIRDCVLAKAEVRGPWLKAFAAYGGFAHVVNRLVRPGMGRAMLGATVTQPGTVILVDLVRAVMELSGGESSVRATVTAAIDPGRLGQDVVDILSAALAMDSPPTAAVAQPPKVTAAAAAEAADADEQRRHAGRVLGDVVTESLRTLRVLAQFADKSVSEICFGRGDWRAILSLGLAHSLPEVRHALALWIRSVCIVPEAFDFLIPKLLAGISNLVPLAKSPVATDYVNLLQHLLIGDSKSDTKDSDRSKSDAKEGDGKYKVEKDRKEAPSAKDRANGGGFWAVIFEKIAAHPIVETSPADQDLLLAGLLELGRKLVVRWPACRSAIAADRRYGAMSLLRALLEIPSDAALLNTAVPPPPKCKSNLTRLACYDVLTDLLAGSTDARQLRAMLGYVAPLHSTSVTLDWSHAAPPAKDAKSVVPYLGLRNAGCVCYMNSNLQQLFMTPAFRRNIMAIDCKPDAADTLAQLQQLFVTMQESKTLVDADPRAFIQTLRGDDGKEINVSIQEDSSGFLQRLLEKIDTAVRGTPYEGAVRNVYGGSTVTHKIGRGTCNHVTERVEPMLGQQIVVLKKRNLNEGLQAFVAGQELDDITCEACRKPDGSCKKVPIFKRDSFRDLPPTMVTPAPSRHPSSLTAIIMYVDG